MKRLDNLKPRKRTISLVAQATGILTICCLISSVHVVQAQRAIPDNNLAYPVFIELHGQGTTGFGSGFYLNTQNETYLVTAKHVFFDLLTGNLSAPKATLISYDADPNESGRNVFSVDLEMALKEGLLKGHPRMDVAVLLVGKDSGTSVIDGKTLTVAMPPKGITLVESTKHGIVGVPFASVKTFNQVQVANDVVVFGYPISLRLSGGVDLDPYRPLLRKGILAGTNATKKLLIIDSPTYNGNSGGPILEITHKWPKRWFSIIGVVNKFVPFDSAMLSHLPPEYSRTLSNSGYTVATPMDFVLELIPK